MLSLNSLKIVIKTVVLILLTMSLTACGTMPGQKIEGLDLRIDKLDSQVSESCLVPPVARNAKIATLQQRNALFECKDKHGAAVGAYDRVRNTYAGKSRQSRKP